MKRLGSGFQHKYIIHPITAQAHFKRDRSETPLRTRSRPRLSCEVTVNEVNLSLDDVRFNKTCLLASVYSIEAFFINDATFHIH